MIRRSWATLGHALLFCTLSVAVGFWIPIALALYSNELRRGQGLLKLVFFLPFLTPSVPAVVLWRWIFDQGYGLLNSLISFLPFVKDPHIPWLNEPLLAMLAVVVVFLWREEHGLERLDLPDGHQGCPRRAVRRPPSWTGRRC